VVVKFPHGDTIRPGGPLGADAVGDTEDGGAASAG